MLKKMVSITVLAVRVPSCPMLRAMTKLLTVVGLASMARAATSLSSRTPMATAMGRKRAARSTSLRRWAKAGFQRPPVLFRSKEAQVRGPGGWR